jgi:sodium/hydrogen exchanger-like protein 6/7
MVGGGSTVTLLTWLGIPIGVDDEETADGHHNGGERTPLTPNLTPKHYRTSVSSAEPATPNPVSSHSLSFVHDGAVAGEKSILAKYWSGFDNRFMKPFLTHSNPTLMETLPTCCLPLSRLLTSTEQLMKHPAMMNSADFITDSIVVQNDGDVISSPPESVLPVTSQAAKTATGASNSSLQFVESPSRDKLDLTKGFPSQM